jgi:replicative DNA helicase
MNEFDRIPPNAPDIEKCVLSSFFNSDKTFKNYAYQINPEYFYQSKHRKIFEFMVDKNCCDVMIIANMYPDAAVDISEISERYSSNCYLEAEISVLKDKFERRKIIEVCTEKILAAFSDMDISARDISEKIITELNATNSYERFPVPINEIVPLLFEKFELLSKQGCAIGLKTGISDIDNLIGGFVDSEMVLIAGRPSMGKTAFALQIAAHNAISGIPVLIFSIETSNEQIGGRMLCAHAGVSFDDILRGQQLQNQQWQALGLSAGTVAEFPVYIDETPAIPIMQLIAKAENYVKSKGIKLIIADHIGLITNSDKGRSRNEELSVISKRLKALGKNMNIPIIALCQLSREVEKRQPPIPRLSDLYESGSLEQDSDKVLFLFRDEYYNRNSDKKGIAEIILAKNKNGRTGYKEVFFNKPTMTFKNLSKEKDPMEPDHWSDK